MGASLGLVVHFGLSAYVLASTRQWQLVYFSDLQRSAAVTEPTEMERRIARAICAAEGHDPDADWRDVGGMMLGVEVANPARWTQYVREARAAIAAMREPTDARVCAGRSSGSSLGISDAMASAASRSAASLAS
jgi:hypothetical protein